MALAPSFQIIPKDKRLAVWQSNVILLSGLAGCLLIALFYAFLLNKSAALKEQLQTIEKQDSILASQDVENLKAQIIEKINIIDSFAHLTSSEKKPIKIFNFLKAICQQKTRVLQISFTAKDRALEVNFLTDSFKSLGEQILILKNSQDIEGFQTSNISMQEDGIEFSCDIVLKESFLSQ